MPCRPLVASLLVSALALAACGGTHEADRQDVENAVKGVYDGLAAKDPKKVCARISEKDKKEISATAAQSGGKKQSCEQVLKLALAFGGNSLDQAKDVKVSDVKLDGDQAQAVVSLQGRKSKVGLIKEDGDWKLSGLNLTGG